MKHEDLKRTSAGERLTRRELLRGAGAAAVAAAVGAAFPPALASAETQTDRKSVV
jgi:secreted PhoX family phosphatase